MVFAAWDFPMRPSDFHPSSDSWVSGAVKAMAPSRRWGGPVASPSARYLCAVYSSLQARDGGPTTRGIGVLRWERAQLGATPS
ncbi:uncharacterized protein BDW47DRAFT_100049 [Aspergillus candidus]|uniref:Uncharacterized protein n=1 Tax=Aspergillus candidus TaxID=41067 RepID=A0A2I2FL72_ASPCN|nr:hypothetical protein BDW47DRAFT_100049 [Aspergillus candidus]PLB41388.1 hypothetical protein BDW47DRAFT_100049 [Aspergillus candidus]